MDKFRLVVPSGSQSGPLEFESPSVASSLVVAGINLSAETAELHHDGRRIATLRKGGNAESPYWEVNPA